MNPIEKLRKTKSASMRLIRENNLDSLLDVALFIIITLTIHYSYRFWANQLHYFPVADLIASGREWLSWQVYVQSTWFVEHVLGIDFTAVDQNSTMYFPNNGFISVNRSCSGFKQMLQFGLLMMVFPGPWKHKLWYIPMGIFIMHLTNLFRITGLSVVIINWPEYWDFSHDYLFRPFFYVVIFSLWVIWTERFRGRMKKTKAE